MAARANLQKSFEKANPNSTTMHKLCFENVNKEQKKIQEFFNKVLQSNLPSAHSGAKAKTLPRDDRGRGSLLRPGKAGANKFALLGSSKALARDGSLEDPRQMTMNTSKDIVPVEIRHTVDMTRPASKPKAKITTTRATSKKELANVPKRSCSSGKRLGKEAEGTKGGDKLDFGNRKHFAKSMSKEKMSGKVVIDGHKRPM